MSTKRSRQLTTSSSFRSKILSMKKILLIALMSSFFALPTGFVAAQTPPKLDYSGFVNCDGVLARKIDKKTGQDIGAVEGEQDRQNECHFSDLMELVIKMINWLFFISIPLTTALFAYAGVLYMSGAQGKIKTAKSIFASVAIGFIIMCTAWVIMRTLVGWFVKDTDATMFLQ